MSTIHVFAGSVMDTLSEEGVTHVLGLVLDKTGAEITGTIAHRRVSSTAVAVRVEVGTAPSEVRTASFEVLAEDGSLVVSAFIADAMLRVEMVASISGRSVSATPFCRDEELHPVSGNEAMAFARALASAWLRTAEGERFHSGAMVSNAFGVKVDDVRVAERPDLRAVSTVGNAAVSYLMSALEGAVLLSAPVSDEGCEAFHEFAASFSADGRTVAKVENPARENETGNNIFLLSVASVKRRAL